MKAMVERSKNEETEESGAEGDVSVSGNSSGYYFSDNDEVKKAKELAEDKDENLLLFKKDASETDDYEMTNVENDNAVVGHEPESEVGGHKTEKKELQEGTGKQEETVIHTEEKNSDEKKTEGREKRDSAETERSVETEKQTDVDAVVTDAIGIDKEDNQQENSQDSIGENHNNGTAENQIRVVQVGGDDPSDVTDDSSESENEDTTDGTFTGFSGMSGSARSSRSTESTSISGSEMDRYIPVLFLIQNVVTDSQTCESFGVKVAHANTITIVYNQL